MKRKIIIGIVILLVVWLAFTFVLLPRLLNVECITFLGGSECYNLEGTLVGLTPDAYGAKILTEAAAETLQP